MATIPLEDNFTDILGKTQRGLQLADGTLAARAGVTESEMARVKSGAVDTAVLRKLAAALNLGPDSLVASAQKSWYPDPIHLNGLAQFNTIYEDMTVNAYLVWDPASRLAAVDRKSVV